MADETEKEVYEIPLADSLEQAAEDEEVLARLVASMGHAEPVLTAQARAKKFREQAQNIRELIVEYTTTEEEPSFLDVIEALTGVVL